VSARYATNTSVSPERSQEEVKRMLRRYGADRFGVMEETKRACVMFEFNGLTVRIDVPLPSIKDEEICMTETGRERSESQCYKALEAMIRQRWRALLLAIKAKLEAVECGISTIETEFMPFMVMPDGRLMKDHILPHLEEAVKTGKMPRMLALPAGANG